MWIVILHSFWVNITVAIKRKKNHWKTFSRCCNFFFSSFYRANFLVNAWSKVRFPKDSGPDLSTPLSAADKLLTWIIKYLPSTSTYQVPAWIALLARVDVNANFVFGLMNFYSAFSKFYVIREI